MSHSFRSVLAFVAASVVGSIVAPPRARAQDLLADLPGPQADSSFGIATAAGGDVDGDGVSELLVGGRSVDAAGTAGFEVFLYSGATRALVRSHFQAGFNGFGWSLAFLDDVDGDGVDEYLIDEYGSTARSGHIYSGASGALVRSGALPTTFSFATSRVFPIGDADGDGTGDYAAIDIGFNNCALGANSGKTGASIWSSLVWRYGTDGSSIPDVDGDGVDDVALSNWSAAEVDLYSGSNGSLITTLTGASAEGFGIWVGRTGDVDGDGLDDIAVSAPAADGDVPGGGVIYVYSGADQSLLRTLRSDLPGNDSAYFGWVVEDAGDVNGDGAADVLAVTQLDAKGLNGGAAYLFSGSTGERLYRFEEGTTINWGTPPAKLGDLDGDGLAEVALPDVEVQLSPPAPGRGRVRIVRGNDLYLLATPKSPKAGKKLSLETREGTMTQIVVTVIVAVNGVPAFQPVGGLGTFDPTGGWEVSGIVPAGLSGVTLDLRSWAQSAPRGVRDSAVETITFP